MGSFCIRKEAEVKPTSQIIESLEFKNFFTLKNSGNLPDGCSEPKKLDFYYATEFKICCVFFMQQN